MYTFAFVDIFDALYENIGDPKYLVAFLGVVITLVLRSLAGWTWRLCTASPEIGEKARLILDMLNAEGEGANWELDLSRDKGFLRRHPVQIDLDFRSPWVHVNNNDLDSDLTTREKKQLREAALRIVARKKRIQAAMRDDRIITALRREVGGPTGPQG